MEKHIFKHHIKTLLLYHLVFPLKYKKSIINGEIGKGLKQICIDISARYEVHFIEIGYGSNHVHFLVQSVANYSASKMITILKSITAKELFKRYPEIKLKLWVGKFWTIGYYVNTVGQYSNEEVIRAYVKKKNGARIH